MIGPGIFLFLALVIVDFHEGSIPFPRIGHTLPIML